MNTPSPSNIDEEQPDLEAIDRFVDYWYIPEETPNPDYQRKLDKGVMKQQLLALLNTAISSAREELLEQIIKDGYGFTQDLPAGTSQVFYDGVESQHQAWIKYLNNRKLALKSNQKDKV